MMSASLPAGRQALESRGGAARFERIATLDPQRIQILADGLERRLGVLDEDDFHELRG